MTYVNSRSCTLVQRHKSALLNIFLDDNYLYDTDALFLSFQTNLNPKKLVYPLQYSEQ